MPNGRSDEFMMRKGEIVQLLKEHRKAMLRTNTSTEHEEKMKSAGELVAVAISHPDDRIYVEEIDYATYLVYLGVDISKPHDLQQLTLVYIDWRMREDDSAESSLFSQFRQYHLLRSLSASDARQLWKEGRGRFDHNPIKPRPWDTQEKT